MPRVVLGVCGGIAAYKAVDLCRRLVDAGVHVAPILTDDAQQFIGALTFSALASEPARTSLFGGPEPIPHSAAEITLVSIVTAALRASALPLSVAPVVKVMLASARMFPLNEVVVPTVAELPICQNTLQSSPPLRTRTDELLAVVSVVPIWNTNDAAGSPCASSVSVPVSCADEAKW